MELHKRVATRYRLAEAIANIPNLASEIGRNLVKFVEFEQTARDYQGYLAEIKKILARDPYSEDQKPYWEKIDSHLVEYRLGIWVSHNYYLWFRDTWELSLAVLQQFSLPAPLRRKIEQTAKYWASKQKAKSYRFKGTQLDKFDTIISTYLTQTETILDQFSAITEALSKGKPMSEDDGSKLKVGPFTLVNTGGFKPEVMNDVAETVKKATSLIMAKGYGKILYGDIMVTKKVGRSNVLAFYMMNSDELLIRAGLRMSVDSIHTVLHELSHRLHRKFLQSKDQKIRALYQKYKIQKDYGSVDSSMAPQVGEEVEHKGKTLVVDRIGYSGRDLTIHLYNKAEPDRKYSVPLKHYVEIFKTEEAGSRPNQKGFVSGYAGKSDGENFAEMMAYYFRDQLSEEQLKDLEEVLS